MADIHKINIRTGDEIAFWIKVPVSNIHYFSRKLGAAVDHSIQAFGSTETTVDSTDAVSDDTLRFLLRSFAERRPLNTEFKRFDDLSELAVALWEFECKPALFASFAQAFRPNVWTQDPDGGTGAGTVLDWAFVAFVFGWEDIFEQTTQELIVGGKDPTIWQSPLAGILDLHNERLALLRKTYKFIGEAILREVVGHHQSTDWIMAQLKDVKLDMKQEEEANPYLNDPTNFTPREMLGHFEQILKSQPRSPSTSVSASHSSSELDHGRRHSLYRDPTAPKGRGAGAGQHGTLRRGLSKLFTPTMQPPSRWRQEDRKKWTEITDNTLIPKIGTFRNENFKGLLLGNFEATRSTTLIL